MGNGRKLTCLGSQKIQQVVDVRIDHGCFHPALPNLPCPATFPVNGIKCLAAVLWVIKLHEVKNLGEGYDTKRSNSESWEILQ